VEWIRRNQVNTEKSSGGTRGTGEEFDHRNVLPKKQGSLLDLKGEGGKKGGGKTSISGPTPRKSVGHGSGLKEDRGKK